VFVAAEVRTPFPLMPLRLLRVRTVAGGSLVAAAFMSSFGMQLFFLTQYLQQVLAEGPFVAGLMFLPLVLTVVVGNQVGGRLVERWGSARTLAAGMAFGALGLLVYVLLPPTESLAVLLPGMVVAGLGQGVAFTTLYLAAGTGVFAGEQGVASAVTSTAQQLGASIGLAGLVALLSWRAAALGGPGSALTGASPGVLTGALHSVFAAQAGIAFLGAAAALLVIGDRRPRWHHRGPAVGGRGAEAARIGHIDG
jgi:MFS family permease